MKKLEIVVRPYKVEDVKESLTAAGIHGMTVYDVKGFGRQHGHKEVYRGAEYTVDFNPKVKIECVVDDLDVDRVIDTVLNSAKTGQIGDGKIFVLPVERVIRIRTGEDGPEAV